MKKETKRQHYVPRTYLKRFENQRNKDFIIYAANKENLEKIISPNITKVCVENDLYTLNGENESERQFLETFYAENVEERYDEVYQVLTDESVHEISAEMHYQIILTVLTMLYRTSKWVHMDNDLFDRHLEKLFARYQQNGNDYFKFEEIGYSSEGKTLKEVQQDFRKLKKDSQVLFQLEVAMKLIDIRRHDGLMVDKLSDENQFFTSDNPVIMENMQSGPIAPLDPENMIRLPLDTKHILTIMPHSQSDGKHLIIRARHLGGQSIGIMVSNNYSQLASCHRYILGSQKGLNDYISKMGEYERPIDEKLIGEVDEIKERIRKIAQSRIGDL